MLPARSRRLAGLTRFCVWIFGLRCSRRRSCSRRWIGRCAWQWRSWCACQFGTLLEPRLIILWRVDHQRALHSRMAETAKLTANHFVSSRLNWLEPHRNERTGDCVRRDAHARQEEVVDYIFGRKLDDDRPIHRHMQLTKGHNVVFARRIIRIEAKRVRIAHEVQIAPAKLSIRAG